MAASVHRSQSSVKRIRRGHQKSRNGCFECKRRRVKCDEAKPSCERCALLQDKCVYPLAPQSIANRKKNEVLRQSLSNIVFPPSPDPSSCSAYSPSFAASACSPTGSLNHCSNSVVETLEPISDVVLYHHYLQHTSQTLTTGQQDQIALKNDLPELALENKTVFHSMLAVSAACMCCDAIAKETETSTSAVSHLLMAGYRHYNLASEQMRESISTPDTLKPDHLLASAVLLVPFATASQQINHWISRSCKGKSSTGLLLTTPRDAMILMRGIRATLQTLYCGTQVSNLELTTESAISACNPSAESNISSALPPSRTHVMFTMIATTSQSAFSKLRERLESAADHRSEGCNDGLLACKAAFKTVDHLRTKIFRPTKEVLEYAQVTIPQIPPWLRSFTSRAANPQPHETLTSFFLSFLVQAPQAYLDLVLPLLDQRLESPVELSSKVSPVIGVTTVQALALDIYAHWSVLMFLVEDDSWWIGNLPEVTLAGMVNTFGDDFVTKIVPRSDPKPDRWWPGGMLNILREVKRFR